MTKTSLRFTSWIGLSKHKYIIGMANTASFLCEGEIVLHFQGSPYLHKLALEDGKSMPSYFHTDCWWRYKRDKANKRRRVRYADTETMEKQKEESVKAAKAANHAAKNAGTSPMNTGNEPKSKRPRKDEEPTRISKEL